MNDTPKVPITLELLWKGPFTLSTPEERRHFDPPTGGGLYLWCVGRHPGYRVSWVGQSGNLEGRMYSHICSILGGAYWLYSDAHLIDGLGPVQEYAEYKPGLKNILEVFLADFGKHSSMALRNLQSYTFFWAEFPGELPGGEDRWKPSVVRKAVESALITEAKKRGEPLQNGPRSLGSAKSPRVTIKSRFLRAGFEVPGIPEEIQYGEKD